MKISQAYVSPTLEKTFGSNFRSKWGFKKYSDIRKPAVFFGMYSDIDRKAFINHKGISIVVWGGGDMKPNSLQLVKSVIDANRSYTGAYSGEFSDILKSNGISHKQIYIPLKDYSNFTPTPLGDKIYAYRGVNGNRESYFKWNEVISPIIKHFGEDTVIYTERESIDNLLENYYKKSFIYIKPTPKGGCTAMFELGHMGRKTIGNGLGNLPNVLSYKSTSDIIKLIEDESKYIGKIRYDICTSTKNIFIGSEWTHLDFWR